MTVQFILGRSGSGKTHYCLEAIKAELSRSPQGCPLILLVPEQATFQMEQALLTDGQLGGYNRANVLSFDRLARRILWETGAPQLPLLSEFGKQMVIRRLLQQLQGQITTFQRVTDRSGFVKQLSATISELRQYRHKPEQLHLEYEQLSQVDDPSLKPLTDKLTDLTLIYKSYQDYINERFLDPDDFLDLAASRCGQVSFLHKAHLWVDGFAGFTPQQYHILSGMIHFAERTEISLCLDPHSSQTQIALDCPNEPGRLDSADLFHPTLQTYQRLLRLLDKELEVAVSPEPPILLPFSVKTENHSNDQQSASDNGFLMPRFQESEPLACLEQNFLNRNNDKKDIDQPRPAVSGLNDIPVKNVVVVEAPQRRAEVEAAAQHILCLCREHNYRFRDIAVILRDFTDYQELIEAVFSDYGIAYFIDRRRSVHHHPLIELLRSGLAALVSDFKTEHIIDYLKTDLVPLPREAVDELENYCLAHGIQSAPWRAEQPWKSEHADKKRNSDATDNPAVDQIDSYRREAVAVLLEIRADLYGKQFQPGEKLSVRKITGRIVYLLEKLKVAESLSRWYRDEQSHGRVDQAQTHEQIYNDVIDRLDDVVAALGENEITLREYAEILDGAWEQMTLRLIPPVLDQVLVGTIERSRHPQIQAAFVLGLNERKFPQVMPPDAFFTDPQRELLQEGGFELGPASNEKLLHERYLAYIALTRARKFLWAGYVVADDKANVLNPSSFIDNIFDAVDDAVFVRLGEDTGQANADKINTVGQLAGQLARAFSDSRQSCHSIDPLWEQLYHYAYSRDDWAGSLRRGLAGLTYRNLAVLDSVTVDKLFTPTLAGSVSRLETFAACPFQFFARYVLRIEPRAELKLAAPDMGSFYHEALYQIFLSMRRAELDWSDLSDIKIEDFIAEAVNKLTERGRDFAELREQSSRNRFLLSLAAERLGGFCRSLRATAAAGDFYQRYGELDFGDGGTIPALEIAMAGDRRLLLRGKIDRIDMCAGPNGRVGLSVIDYKTSARSFSFVRFYHGLSLQLISYLLVLQNHYSLLDGAKTGHVEPAAALYLPIHRQGDSHKEPPPEDVLEGRVTGTEKLHKAAGIMNHQWLSVLDHTVNFGKWSSYYSFAVNKDGSVRNVGKSGVIEPDEMRRMLIHGRKKLAQMADEILDGKIDVAPYRLGEKETPCSHCDYRTFCRFDFSSDPYRQLPQYNKLEVLGRITDNS